MPTAHHSRKARATATAGALLTFATFVAHDALQDHYKDQADELVSARIATESNRVALTLQTSVGALDEHMQWYGQTRYGNAPVERVVPSRLLAQEDRDYLLSLNEEAFNLRGLVSAAEGGEAALRFDEKVRTLEAPAQDAVSALPNLEAIHPDRPLNGPEHNALQKAHDALG